MRLHRITPAVILGIAVGGLFACRSDSVLSPDSRQVLSADRQSRSGSTLIVDDDGANCRRADFTKIQDAVDAAEPGSRILVCAGTYHEQVTIAKNDLRVLAKGKRGDVVLDGLDAPDMIAGFLLDEAHGNLIEGFLVRNYHEAGIWLVGSSRNTIRKNVTTSSPHHDGIQVADSPENVVEHNTSFANVSPGRTACGINVIGPGSVGNIVRHNETFENDFGIQVAGGAANNVIFRNRSHDNRRWGIRNVGSSNGTVIEQNRVFKNKRDPADPAGAGIAVFAGGTGVTVERNKAFDNEPDLFWDGVGANTFENNHCETSAPPELCKRGDDDDDGDDEGD